MPTTSTTSRILDDLVIIWTLFILSACLQWNSKHGSVAYNKLTPIYIVNVKISLFSVEIIYNYEEF